MCEHLTAAHPAATVRVMDAQLLEFPAGRFDLVAAAFVIHLLDDLFEEFAVHLLQGESMGQLVDAADLLEAAGLVDLRDQGCLADVAALMFHRYGAAIQAQTMPASVA
jgi:hypothetical protein